MKNQISVRTKLSVLAGALVLTALALLAPRPAQAICPETIDIICSYSGGGYCLTSGCATHKSYCTGTRTGTVTCRESVPYMCCQLS